MERSRFEWCWVLHLCAQMASIVHVFFSADGLDELACGGAAAEFSMKEERDTSWIMGAPHSSRTDLGSCSIGVALLAPHRVERIPRKIGPVNECTPRDEFRDFGESRGSGFSKVRDGGAEAARFAEDPAVLIHVLVRAWGFPSGIIR